MYVQDSVGINIRKKIQKFRFSHNACLLFFDLELCGAGSLSLVFLFLLLYHA